MARLSAHSVVNFPSLCSRTICEESAFRTARTAILTCLQRRMCRLAGGACDGIEQGEVLFTADVPPMIPPAHTLVHEQNRVRTRTDQTDFDASDASVSSSDGSFPGMPSGAAGVGCVIKGSSVASALIEKLTAIISFSSV